MGICETIKFAVIGYGNQGKRHVGAIEKNPCAELCAIIDIDSDKLAGLNGLAYSNLKDMATAGINPDVIIVASPNGMHEGHALAALSYSDYVVIEKPVSIRDSKQLLSYVDRIFCVMQNRFTPAAQWLKSLDFGKVFSVHVNCFWNRQENYYRENSWRGTIQMDGGTLYTQFSHFIDILLWVFGSVELKSSMAYNLNHSYTDIDDCGAFTFLLKDGIGSFNYSVNASEKNMESSITVIGEKGTVKIGGQYMQDIDYCVGFDIPPMPVPNMANQYGGKYEGSANNIQAVIDNVVNTLHGKETIAVPITDGIKVVNLINKVYQNVLWKTKKAGKA